MTYTVFAYKPDSDDYCRGCHVASYSSDFEYKITDDREEVIKFLVEKYRANKHMDYNETEYGITLLFNGKEPCDEAVEATKNMMAEAEVIAEREEIEAKAAAEKEAAHKKAVQEAEAKAKQEEADRKTYEKLKAKYEGGEDV